MAGSGAFNKDIKNHNQTGENADWPNTSKLLPFQILYCVSSYEYSNTPILTLDN